MALASDDISLSKLERQQIGNHDVWTVWLSLSDGSIMPHVFPTDALEWRAAEYDIDPTDTDTLLDVVLAEPWMRDGIGSNHARSLHRAESIDDARVFHLGRVAVVKARHRFAAAAGAPLVRRRLREESPIDAAVIEVKRELTRRARLKVREEAVRLGTLAGQGGPDRLKALLRRLERDDRKQGTTQ